jgi:hypothetical protein
MAKATIERRCHWLSRNKSSKRPSAVLFFDTESYIIHPSEREEQHAFRLGVGCLTEYDPQDGLRERSWFAFDDPRELWVRVVRAARTYEELYVVSHNIDYDARVSMAFEFLPEAQFVPEFAVISPSCTYFTWEREGVKIHLLDNLNLFGVPLANLGESVGVPKGEVDFEASSDEELYAYCANDVKILVAVWKRWLRFLDEGNLGNFGITIAKQAHNAYRHTFMPVKIGIHNNAEAIELERDAYRGARNEVFKVGKFPPGAYYKLDVNGLYAYLMKHRRYPRRLVKVIYNTSPEYLWRLMDDYLIIAEVIVSLRTPYLPVRVRGRNAYPVGEFATTLTTPELHKAIARGEVKAVGRVALYEPANLFSDYIDYFTPLRQQAKRQGDYAQSQMAKLMRNSLQGKFGQRGHSQEVIGEAPIGEVGIRRFVDADTGAQCVDLTFGGRILRQSTKGEAFDSFPAIPAHVNAYGRQYMWSLMNRAGRRNVFYTDTDSLIVNLDGYDNLEPLIDEERLGALKIEGLASDVEIYARKDYQFGDKQVIKGIRHNAEREAPGVFNQWHFTTLKYAFQSRRLEGVTLRKVRKTLSRQISAGVVGGDGWIEPLRLSLNLQDLQGLLDPDRTDKAWTWEFDPTFLESLGFEGFESVHPGRVPRWLPHWLAPH